MFFSYYFFPFRVVNFLFFSSYFYLFHVFFVISDLVYASSFSYISFSRDHALSHPAYVFFANVAVWVHFTIIVNTYPWVWFTVFLFCRSFLLFFLGHILLSQLIILCWFLVSPLIKPLGCFLFSLHLKCLFFLLSSPHIFFPLFIGLSHLIDSCNFFFSVVFAKVVLIHANTLALAWHAHSSISKRIRLSNETTIIVVVEIKLLVIILVIILVWSHHKIIKFSSHFDFSYKIIKKLHDIILKVQKNDFIVIS